MDFVRNRVLRRFSFLGRLGDVVLVVGLMLRLAQRQGWVSDDQVDRMGLAGAAEQPIALGEMALAAGALWRLLRRRRSRRA